MRRCRCALIAGSAAAIGTSMANSDPLPGCRPHGDRAVQHLGHALDDGQAEAKTRRAVAVGLQPLELLEDHIELRLRNAGAGVVNLDPQTCRRAGGSPSAPGPRACT